MSYFHEEQRFGRWLWVLIAVIAVPVLVGTLGAAASGTGSAVATLAAPATAVAVLVVLALAKLVTDVDQRGIHVAFHLLWPARHIPLDDVQRAHAIEYSPIGDYGGWGVRLSWKGWAFNTGGTAGVLVETKSRKRIMIGSHRAKDLEDSIAKAIAARSG